VRARGLVRYELDIAYLQVYQRSAGEGFYDLEGLKNVRRMGDRRMA
jgi:hypothetical protein